MSLIDFAKVIFGLAIGALVTGTIFVIGYGFFEFVLSGEKQDGFLIVMAILIWIMVSYGVIALVL